MHSFFSTVVSLSLSLLKKGKKRRMETSPKKRKIRLYEVKTPYLDKDLELRRKKAIITQRHRDKQKQEFEKLRRERDHLKQELVLINEELESLKRDMEQQKEEFERDKDQQKLKFTKTLACMKNQFENKFKLFRRNFYSMLDIEERNLLHPDYYYKVIVEISKDNVNIKKELLKKQYYH